MTHLSYEVPETSSSIILACEGQQFWVRLICIIKLNNTYYPHPIRKKPEQPPGSWDKESASSWIVELSLLQPLNVGTNTSFSWVLSLLAFSWELTLLALPGFSPSYQDQRAYQAYASRWQLQNLSSSASVITQGNSFYKSPSSYLFVLFVVILKLLVHMPNHLLPPRPKTFAAVSGCRMRGSDPCPITALLCYFWLQEISL